MSTFYTNVVETPVGPASITVDAEGRLAGFAFQAAEGELHPERTKRVEAQVAEYFAGKRRTFDLELSPQGSEFQRAVWEELVNIPFGETRSYGDLAKVLGRAGAARAVGRANATNPVALIVPCHRVVGSSGALTGFAYGVDVKRWLLDFEKEHAGLFAGM